MKKTYKNIIIFIILILSLPSIVFAHKGRTDSNGGHTDRSTGEYHYHHGYGPHQHPGGVCPYDYDDKTSYSSGTSSTTQTSAPVSTSSKDSNAINSSSTNVNNTSNNNIDNTTNIQNTIVNTSSNTNIVNTVDKLYKKEI